MSLSKDASAPFSALPPSPFGRRVSIPLPPPTRRPADDADSDDEQDAASVVYALDVGNSRTGFMRMLVNDASCTAVNDICQCALVVASM